MAEILAASCGCLAPDRDPRCFADAPVKVMSGTALRKRLGMEAAAHAAHWSDAACSEKLASIYQALTRR